MNQFNDLASVQQGGRTFLVVAQLEQAKHKVAILNGAERSRHVCEVGSGDRLMPDVCCCEVLEEVVALAATDCRVAAHATSTVPVQYRSGVLFTGFSGHSQKSIKKKIIFSSIPYQDRLTEDMSAACVEGLGGDLPRSKRV